MILVAKGKDKKEQKTAQTGLKKYTYFFFLRFCQSSGEHELNSYTPVQNRYTPSPAHGVQN
jgi:hypothetical protein